MTPFLSKWVKDKLLTHGHEKMSGKEIITFLLLYSPNGRKYCKIMPCIFNALSPCIRTMPWAIFSLYMLPLRHAVFETSCRFKISQIDICPNS